MRGNPERAKLATAEKPLAHAVVNVVSEVPSADVEGLGRTAALGAVARASLFPAGLCVDLDHAIGERRYTLPPTPFCGWPFRGRGVHFLDVPAVHKANGLQGDERRAGSIVGVSSISRLVVPR